MKNSAKISLVILGISVLFSTASFSVPALFHYQGRLLSDDGSPVTSTVEINVSMWSAESGGTQLGGGFSHTEMVTPNSDGIYSIAIGSIPVSLFKDNDPVWMELVIEGEILAPRTEILAVPYAMVAASAITAGDSDTVDGFEAADLDESADVATNANAIAAETIRASSMEQTNAAAIASIETDGTVDNFTLLK